MSEAYAGPSQVPPWVVVYSDIALGKTVDLTLADPTGYTLGEPGCLRATRWFLGDALYADVQSRFVPAPTLEHTLTFLTNLQAGHYPQATVRLDDMTLQAEAQTMALKEQYDRSHSRQMWDRFRQIVTGVKGMARTMGVPILSSAHTSQPRTSTTQGFLKGGPDMGAPSVMGIIPASADIILRAMPDPDAYPHGVAYWCKSPDASWTYKDRENVVPRVAPMNTRELLYAAGIVLPRHPQLTWMDEHVDAVAARLAAGEAQRDAMRAVTQDLIGQGVYEGHAYWVVRDGVARYQLQSLRQTPLTRALAEADPSPAVGVNGALAPSSLAPLAPPT